MTDNTPLFTGEDPIALAQKWLTEAEATEPNDPNAMALATVDPEGMPNVRMVLLKEIEQSDATGAGGGFVFYTNHESAKGREILGQKKAALVLHWKSLRRQIRVRGPVEEVSAPQSDDYYASRAYQSRIGAWASRQSRPLNSRAALMADVAKFAARYPINPPRPPHWGGFRICPVEIELWADGDFRLHDRFRFTRAAPDEATWERMRLNP